MHLAFTLVFTGGVILVLRRSNMQQCQLVAGVAVGVVLPMFLFGNWAEWAGAPLPAAQPEESA
jgi:multisubunit Na+/H+ antiporter MnhC subunit